MARLFAWFGALLFFLSLAFFLFTYVVTFAVPAPPGNTWRAVTWNVLLFTVFACHHSIFAREPVRAWIARMLPAGLERSFYVWIASLLFVGVTYLWQPVPGLAWRVDGAARWALWILQAIGVWLTLRSAAILDIRDLAGLRRPEGLRLPSLDDARGGLSAGRSPAAGRSPVDGSLQASGNEFKTSGPYGWVRHPIYTGWFLLVFAASPMTMTRLVFAVVSCAYLLIAIPFEERSMRASTPGAYERYMAQVKWKLIPGLY